jgi:hypothetical protein
MNRLLAVVYLGELQRQAEYALNAVQQVNAGTRQLSSTDSQDRFFHTAEVFRGLHSFLAHTSNMSRLLWPPVPGRRKQESEAHFQARLAKFPRVSRANELRLLLGLGPDEHPLRSRQLRDHLEHFDERLDEWAATSSDHDFVLEHIGPETEIGHLAPGDRVRSFDPDLVVFCLRGERFDVGSLVRDIRQLKERAAGVAFRLHNGDRVGSRR